MQCDSPNKEGQPTLQHPPCSTRASDGQDFELLLAVAPDVGRSILNDRPTDCPITHVGELVAQRGLWQLITNQKCIPLEATGWRHQ